MIADSAYLPDAHGSEQGLQRLLHRFANHLLTTSPGRTATAVSPASQSDIIVGLLTKSRLLGDRVTYLRLLKQFALSLERQIPLGQLDQLLEEALAHHELLTPTEYMDLASTRIRLLTQLGNHTRAKDVLDSSWPLAEGFPKLLCELTIRQALLHVTLGEYSEGQQRYEHGLSLARQTHDAARESIIHNNLGNLLYDLDRYDEALIHYEHAIHAAGHTQDPVHHARAEGNLATALDELRRFQEAEEHFEIAKQAIEAAGDQFLLLSLRLNLSYHALLQEKYDEAVTEGSAALVMARRLGDWQREGFALHNLGQAHLGLKKYGDALDFLIQALDRRISVGQRLYIETTAKFIEQLAEAVQNQPDVDSRIQERLLQDCNQALETARSALSQV